MPVDGYAADEILMFFAAAGVLITGVGAVIVNIIVALRTANKIDEAVSKTDGLVAQVQEVHTLTNSGLSAVKAELATSNALNRQLHLVIEDLKIERSKAQGEGPGVAGEDAEQLEQIEVNTAETAANTKQTERSTKRTETAIEKLAE